MNSYVVFILISIIIFTEKCTVGLDNGLARTPPMGWMSWQRFRCQIDCVNYPNDCISEKLIKRTADKLVSDGWLNIGYKYVIIDDCWQANERDPITLELKPNSTRFQSNLSQISDYLHNRGLLFGIYLDYGTKTCAGYPGSLCYLQVDAKSLSNWKVDYVKMDGCYSSPNEMPDGYEYFSKLLNATKRPIVFSCSYPAYIPWYVNCSTIDWQRVQQNCNLWRMLGDIQDSWWSVISIINAYREHNQILHQIAGPGHWNDPDMLLLGNFGLSTDQKRAQMGMWCMLAAPLLMSADMDQLDQISIDLLKNVNLIAIDQDEGGHQAEYVQTINNVQLWIRKLDSKPTGWAIACLYTTEGGGPIHLQVRLTDFETGITKFTGNKFELMDAFNEKMTFIIHKHDRFKLSINPTGLVLYRIKASRSVWDIWDIYM